VVEDEEDIVGEVVIGAELGVLEWESEVFDKVDLELVDGAFD
jgi:hypothetical protein